jgi:rubredoxin
VFPADLRWRCVTHGFIVQPHRPDTREPACAGRGA